jgi:hypothetical protein
VCSSVSIAVETSSRAFFGLAPASPNRDWGLKLFADPKGGEDAVGELPPTRKLAFLHY